MGSVKVFEGRAHRVLPALAEQLETLFRADSLAAGLTAGAVSENVRLPYRSPAYFFGFVTAHLRRIPSRSFRIGCDASTVRMLRGALIFKRVSIANALRYGPHVMSAFPESGHS